MTTLLPSMNSDEKIPLGRTKIAEHSKLIGVIKTAPARATQNKQHFAHFLKQGEDPGFLAGKGTGGKGYILS